MVGRRDQVSQVEKSSQRDDARAKWIDANDDKIVEVLAFSDPR